MVASFAKTLMVGTTLAVASPVLAQSATSEPQADDQSGSGLTDIIVTAQRREDNLQRTPLAITALSPDALVERNIRSATELMQVAPGLQVATQGGAGNSSGSATFFLRGMGQQRGGFNGTSPAVAIYLDDIYYPSLQGSVFNILDLERVEVLRGPQGTLFGRNAIGGAIRYATKKPKLSDFSGYVQGTYGTLDRKDLTASVNLGGEKVAARLTFGRLRNDGYVRQQNGGPDAGAAKTDLVRGQLLFAPTDDLEIIISGQYTKSTLDGFPYTQIGPISARPGTAIARWNSSPAGILNPYDNRYTSVCAYCQPGTNKREFSETEFGAVNGSVSWKISDSLSLKSITAWQQVDSDYLADLDASPLPINDSVNSATVKAFSQELQINGRHFDDRLGWVAGLYYYDENNGDRFPKAGEQTSLGGTIPATFFRTKTKTTAAFLDGTFAATDKFTIIGGIRYSVDDKDATFKNKAGALLDSESAKFKSTTWRFGLQYQWSQAIMQYATVSRGFRAGGLARVSGTVGSLDPFDPETATNYETGVRADLFGRKLRLNPTVFYTKWNDIQVQRLQATPQGVNIFVENAAKAHSYGFELEAEAAVTNNLRLFGNMALLRMKYDEVDPATGITPSSPFMRAPRQTYALGANYHRNVGKLRLNASTNWSWQASQWSTPASDRALIPSYGLWNARLEISDPDIGWSLAGYVTNITDKVYYIGGSNLSSAGTGTLRYDLGRPREFGVTAKFSF